jgi:hypothetical protein
VTPVAVVQKYTIVLLLLKYIYLRRLWKIVEQYEMMNHLDKSLIAKKKKEIGKTVRLLDYSTMLTTIGVLALCALL